MSTYLKTLFLVLFLSFTFYSNAFAYEKRQYFYFQYNIPISFYNKVFVSLTSLNEKEEFITTESNYYERDITAYYNSNFLVGYHFVNGYSLEFEILGLDIFFNEKDSVPTTNAQAQETFIKSDFAFMNVKKDFFELASFSLFLKAGVGFAQINPALRNTEGGNDLEFGYNIGLGTTYRVNKYLDFELFYRYLANIANKENVSSTGVWQKYYFQQHSAGLAVKFKF